MLIPIGMSLYASASVLVVLGQEYLPGRIGMASGVTIGLAVSFGGGAAPLIGSVADWLGIAVLPLVLTGISLVATVLGYTLPPRRTGPPGDEWRGTNSPRQETRTS
jgi:FSR family fosmidomycin resistance protein-like MFS transporter